MSILIRSGSYIFLCTLHVTIAYRSSRSVQHRSPKAQFNYSSITYATPSTLSLSGRHSKVSLRRGLPDHCEGRARLSRWTGHTGSDSDAAGDAVSTAPSAAHAQCDTSYTCATETRSEVGLNIAVVNEEQRRVATASAHVPTCPSAQVPKCPSTQVPKYLSTQDPKHPLSVFRRSEKSCIESALCERCLSKDTALISWHLASDTL